MTSTSSIKKWGNSLAIRIPSSVAKDLNLSENSTIQITSDGFMATIRPKKGKKQSLQDLVSAITPDNRHQEVDWGEPVGKEIW